MKIKYTSLHLIGIVFVIILTSSGCISHKCVNPDPSDITINMQIDDFIQGTWKSIQVFDVDGNDITSEAYKAEIQFINNNIVKDKTFSRNGQFLDGETLSYSFIDSKTILLKNELRQGSEYWELERLEDSLIIYIKIGNNSQKTIFIRGCY